MPPGFATNLFKGAAFIVIVFATAGVLWGKEGIAQLTPWPD